MKPHLPHYIRYISARIAGPMLLTCMTLTGVGWLMQSLQFIEYIVNRGLDVGTFFYLTGLILPSILWVILPLSLFIGTLYAYHKLTTESELVILSGAGISVRDLMKPALLFAGIVTLLSYLVGLYLMPASYREFKDMQAFIRNNYASLLLQEGVFSSPTKGLTVYIRERDDDGTLHGMLVHDSREAGKTITYMAENGELVQGANGPHFLLENGNRQEIDQKTGGLTLLDFDRYALELALFSTDINQHRWREPQERYLSELFDPQDSEPRFLQRLRAEGHHRITWPLFNIALAVLALVPFMTGQFSRRGQGKKVAGVAVLALGLIIWGLTLTSMATGNALFVPVMYLTVMMSGGGIYYFVVRSSGSLRVRRKFPDIFGQLRRTPAGGA